MATLVALGVALAIVVGVAGGLDPLGLVILVVLVGVGALGVAVALKAGSGTITPGRCGACGGLVSSNAPYCKHCGATIESSP